MKNNLKIIDTTCINSKWVARWLAKKNQECCQCVVNCKAWVTYRGYKFAVTEEEYEMLKKSTNKIKL